MSSGRPVSLVLGVSSGLGRASARRLAAAGHGIVGVHFDIGDALMEAQRLETELQAASGQARFFNANAAADGTMREVAGEIATLLGSGSVLSMVVHSLSFGSLLPFIADAGAEAVDRRRMDMTLNVMAHSLVYWTQALLGANVIGQGTHIVAFTSAGSSKAATGYGAVSAAKAALEAHVRQLALELAPYRISVNALRAGVTRTPSFDKIPGAEVMAAKALAVNPHGRLTLPEDVGDAVAFLAAMPSSWMTGNVIGVDGGELLTT